MATFHYSMKVGNSGKAKPHYDYIMREGKYALRENESLIFKKNNNFPSWVDTPRDFWILSDHREKTISYREIEVALLEELSDKENIEFLEKYLHEKLSTFSYSVAIHSKPATLDNSKKNIHAHIMFYEREIDFSRPELNKNDYFKKTSYCKDGSVTGGYKKNREFPQPEYLRKLREDWENKLNVLLVEKNITHTVSSKSIKMQKQDAEKKSDFNKAESLDRDAMPRKIPAWIYQNLKKITYYRQNREELDQEINLELKSFCLQEEIVRLKQQILFEKIQDREIIPQDYDKITSLQIYNELQKQSHDQQKKVASLDKEVAKLKFSKLNIEQLEESIINKLSGGQVKTISEQMRSKDSLLSLSIKKVEEFKKEHKGNLNQADNYEVYQSLIKEQRIILADQLSLQTEKEQLVKQYKTKDTKKTAEQFFAKYTKGNFQKLSALKETLSKEIIVLTKTDHAIKSFKDAYLKRDKVAIQSIQTVRSTAHSIQLGASMIKDLFDKEITQQEKTVHFAFKTNDKEKEQNHERER